MNSLRSLTWIWFGSRLRKIAHIPLISFLRKHESTIRCLLHAMLILQLVHSINTQYIQTDLIFVSLCKHVILLSRISKVSLLFWIVECWPLMLRLLTLDVHLLSPPFLQLLLFLLLAWLSCVIVRKLVNQKLMSDVCVNQIDAVTIRITVLIDESGNKW